MINNFVQNINISTEHSTKIIPDFKKHSWVIQTSTLQNIKLISRHRTQTINKLITEITVQSFYSQKKQLNKMWEIKSSDLNQISFSEQTHVILSWCSSFLQTETFNHLVKYCFYSSENKKDSTRFKRRWHTELLQNKRHDQNYISLLSTSLTEAETRVVAESDFLFRNLLQWNQTSRHRRVSGDRQFISTRLPGQL